MAKTKKIQIQCKDRQLRIDMPSTMEDIERVDQESKQFLEKEGLSEEVFSVCLCMREGLTNAVRHGNRNDTSKRVHYSLTRNDRELIMEIADEGDGFDWRSVETVPPELESDHGRGLMIIRKYFTTYSFNEKGNRLTLRKALTDRQ